MGDLFPCTILERKVKVKTTEVERIALGVVRIYKLSIGFQNWWQEIICIFAFI